MPEISSIRPALIACKWALEARIISSLFALPSETETGCSANFSSMTIMIIAFQIIDSITTLHTSALYSASIHLRVHLEGMDFRKSFRKPSAAPLPKTNAMAQLSVSQMKISADVLPGRDKLLTKSLHSCSVAPAMPHPLFLAQRLPHRAFHFQFNQTVHFDRVFHRQFADQRFDETSHDHLGGFFFGQSARH